MPLSPYLYASAFFLQHIFHKETPCAASCQDEFDRADLGADAFSGAAECR
ncbi:MAG: hypothetical protein KF688_13755 [Pirellulales bacterium]|nr:hypothetical protein [Pirellulales bacterium]